MQSSYKSDLVESCKDIQLRASRVKNDANICMQRRIVDMNQQIHVQHDLSVDSNEKSTRTLAVVENLYRFLLSSEARYVASLGQNSKP